MARIKRAVMKNKRKGKILKLAKGFRNARSTTYKQAKQGVIRAGQHAFAHRRKKKRVMRKNWQVKISYAIQNLADMSYSRFMDAVHKKGIEVDRKIMADLIENDMDAFARLVSVVLDKEITVPKDFAEQIAKHEQSEQAQEPEVENKTESEEPTTPETEESSTEEEQEKNS